MKSKIPTGLPDKLNPITVSAVSIEYTQECDLSDNIQELKISIEDNGGGIYIVLSTERWAIDDIDELIHILNDFKARAINDNK